MSTFFEWLIGIVQKLQFWFVVEPWERAVRVRLGKWVVVVQPGFHLKLPLFDEVYVINTRLRVAPTSTQTISTLDGKVVTVSINLGFSIVDPLLAISTYQHPDNSIAVLSHNHVAEYISSKPSDKINIQELEDFIITNLKNNDPDNGITVEFVKITCLVISGTARTFRLINDEIMPGDYSSSRNDNLGLIKDYNTVGSHVTYW